MSSIELATTIRICEDTAGTFDIKDILKAAGIGEDLAQLPLQLLAVGQAGQKVVLGHAQQRTFGLDRKSVV